MSRIRHFIAGALLLLALVAPATATVNTSANKTIVSGNSSQTSFTFSFIGVAAAYISVTFTDASGNQTVLTQGSGTTQYQITLNAPVQGAIWGIGGTIVYNPSGTPIATGTTLTILRTLPLTQAITLQNQASVQTLGKGSEQAVDTAVMQDQQVSEQIGRALQANASNASPPNPLPPAAQAAGLGLCFDGTGNNIIACSLAPAGIISSAMAPVVGASTIALGRTAFGLGTMALENINAGTCGGATIQDDGSGNARVVFGPVADGGNQSVTCAFHGTQRIATGALVYTLPQANTLFSGFGFFINALNNSVTITPNAADNFSGMSSGASMIIPPGTQAYISTNASGSGVWYLNLSSGVSLNAALNLQLSCSVASNALTCNVLDRNGNTPSTASPVLLAFRDPILANGDPIARAITGALSITIPTSATLATVNAQANRIWLAVFDNAGTPVLGVYNSLNSTGPTILSWDETSTPSSTNLTSSSTSAQTWYTSGALTGKSFRILGYVESTQTTAGTWAASPSKIQLFGPGVKKPGESVQTQVSSSTSQPLITSATFVPFTGISVSITPTNAANLFFIDSRGVAANASGSLSYTLQLSRGTIAATNMIGAIVGQNVGSSGGNATTVTCFAADIPNTTSSITYAMQGKTSGGNLSYNYIGVAGIQQSVMTASEIQI